MQQIQTWLLHPENEERVLHSNVENNLHEPGKTDHRSADIFVLSLLCSFIRLIKTSL